MKKEQILEFLDKVAQDEQFKAEAEKFNKKMEAKAITKKDGKEFINKVVLPIAKEFGYTFTLEELAEFFQSPEDGSDLAALSLEDIEDVSGGIWLRNIFAYLFASIGIFTSSDKHVPPNNYLSIERVEQPSLQKEKEIAVQWVPEAQGDPNIVEKEEEIAAPGVPEAKGDPRKEEEPAAPGVQEAQVEPRKEEKPAAQGVPKAPEGQKTEETNAERAAPGVPEAQVEPRKEEKTAAQGVPSVEPSKVVESAASTEKKDIQVYFFTVPKLMKLVDFIKQEGNPSLFSKIDQAMFNQIVNETKIDNGIAYIPDVYGEKGKNSNESNNLRVLVDVYFGREDIVQLFELLEKNGWNVNSLSEKQKWLFEQTVNRIEKTGFWSSSLYIKKFEGLKGPQIIYGGTKEESQKLAALKALSENPSGRLTQDELEKCGVKMNVSKLQETIEEQQQQLREQQLQLREQQKQLQKQQKQLQEQKKQLQEQQNMKTQAQQPDGSTKKRNESLEETRADIASLYLKLREFINQSNKNEGKKLEPAVKKSDE